LFRVVFAFTWLVREPCPLTPLPELPHSHSLPLPCSAHSCAASHVCYVLVSRSCDFVALLWFGADFHAFFLRYTPSFVACASSGLLFCVALLQILCAFGSVYHGSTAGLPFVCRCFDVPSCPLRLRVGFRVLYASPLRPRLCVGLLTSAFILCWFCYGERSLRSPPAHLFLGSPTVAHRVLFPSLYGTVCTCVRIRPILHSACCCLTVFDVILRCFWVPCCSFPIRYLLFDHSLFVVLLLDLVVTTVVGLPFWLRRCCCGCCCLFTFAVDFV